MAREPKTLLDAIRYFSDPDVCLDFMVSLRWPEGVSCPNCGSDEVGFIATRRVWECKTKHAKRQFSVKVGTIFEDSPIGLDKWLAAIWMIANAKNGVSSYEIHRAIGVTQKSAWFMLHRIRLAMQNETFDKFTNEVEADETFIGGLAGNMHKDKKERKIRGRGGTDKTIIFGLLERKGPSGKSRVRAKVVKTRRKGAVMPIILSNVERGTQMYTDALPTYKTWPLTTRAASSTTPSGTLRAKSTSTASKTSGVS